MAGFNQQARVGAEERFIHRHYLTVRQYAVWVILQGFDIAEDVIPAAAVQANNVVTQRVQNLVHLENRRQRFNQQRGFDGAARQVEAVFRKAEYLVPPGRFLPGLRFRQIEIGAAAFGQQRFVVVEKVEREIKQAARDGFTAPCHVLFRQVQAAHAADKHRRVRLELIDFARVVGVADGAVNGIAQVDLAFNDLVPVRCEGILKVSHEHFDVRVHRVNDHFALNRPGNFYAAIL